MGLLFSTLALVTDSIFAARLTDSNRSLVFRVVLLAKCLVELKAVSRTYF